MFNFTLFYLAIWKIFLKNCTDTMAWQKNSKNSLRNVAEVMRLCRNFKSFCLNCLVQGVKRTALYNSQLKRQLKNKLNHLKYVKKFTIELNLSNLCLFKALMLCLFVCLLIRPVKPIAVLCDSTFNRFRMFKEWHNPYSVSLDLYVFWIFFRQGITLPNFIMVGYVRQTLGEEGLFAPISEQPQKGPSWIG